MTLTKWVDTDKTNKTLYIFVRILFWYVHYAHTYTLYLSPHESRNSCIDHCSSTHSKYESVQCGLRRTASAAAVSSDGAGWETAGPTQCSILTFVTRSGSRWVFGLFQTPFCDWVALLPRHGRVTRCRWELSDAIREGNGATTGGGTYFRSRWTATGSFSGLFRRGHGSVLEVARETWRGYRVGGDGCWEVGWACCQGGLRGWVL